MGRRIAYWGTTAIVALMLLASLNYLSGSEQVVSGRLTFNHVALSVADLDRSAEFYGRVLNLSEIDKEARSEGVRRFSLGEGLELHLLGPEYYRGDAVQTNKAVHLALTTDRFSDFLEQLGANGVAYGNWGGSPGEVEARSDGVRQVFFQDPDGYWIEVNSVGQE